MSNTLQNAGKPNSSSRAQGQNDSSSQCYRFIKFEPYNILLLGGTGICLILPLIEHDCWVILKFSCWKTSWCNSLQLFHRRNSCKYSPRSMWCEFQACLSISFHFEECCFHFHGQALLPFHTDPVSLTLFASDNFQCEFKDKVAVLKEIPLCFSMTLFFSVWSFHWVCFLMFSF